MRAQFNDIDEALREILKTAAGKRVLFWVLEQASIYGEAFTGEAPGTDYTLGRQAVGRSLINQLDHIDPRTYPRLLLDIADMQDAERAQQKTKQQPEDYDDEAP